MCRDCKNCTNSAIAHTGRKLGRMAAGFTTLGLSELGMATQKKCRSCGHQMSLHGVGQVGGAVQPTVQIQQQPGYYSAPQTAAPGWYYPHGPQNPPVWWNGQAWVPNA